MIAFLTLCYVAVLALLVYLKVISLNLWWKLSPLLFSLALMVVLIFPMQWGAPSGMVNVYQPVIEIVPNVSGDVKEVLARPLEPIKKGDVLFTIDPSPFQFEVDRFEAALKEAEQAAKMLPTELEAAEAFVAQCEAALVESKQQAETLKLALDAAEARVAKARSQVELTEGKYDRTVKLRETKATSDQELETELRNFEAAKASLDETVAMRDQAKLSLESRVGDVNTMIAKSEAALRSAQAAEAKARIALQSTVDGENTSVTQIRAQLASAKLNLDWTNVRAPADGYAIGLSLRPGQRVAQFPVRAWISFVETSLTRIAVAVPQYAIRHVEPGQQAEVIFKVYPGQTFSATVEAVAYITPAGQLQPSGNIPTALQVGQAKMPYGVILALDDEQIDASKLPGGAVGQAAIYTDHAKASQLIRRVELRMHSWLNYIVP